MNRIKPYLWVSASLAGIMLVGCQTPEESAGVQQIPQITKLCKKATAGPAVHRFRRPLRDKQDRILRQLSAECDRLIADVRTWEGSAQLTAVNAQQQGAVRVDIQSLQTALEGLRDAALAGNMHSLRSTHDQAASAYVRIGQQMNIPDLSGQ